MNALQLRGRRGIERQIVRHSAREARGRAARAALVDEDDVAIAARRLERAAQLQIEVDGALARAAADQQQRVRPRLGAERPEPCDEQLDLRPVGGRGIERHLERAAARVGGRQRIGREAAALVAAPTVGLRARATCGSATAETSRTASTNSERFGMAAHIRASGRALASAKPWRILVVRAPPRRP